MRHWRSLGMACLLLAGCGGVGSPVYVQQSLARLDLPEPPSRTVHLAGGYYSESAFVVLSDDQATSPPSATATTITSLTPRNAKGNDDGAEKLWGRADLTFGHRLTIGASAPRYGGPTMYRAKLYLAGTERERARSGDGSLALTVAYGRDNRTYDAYSGESTQVKRQARDISLVGGAHLGRSGLLYMGPYWQRSDFSFVHQRPSTPDAYGDGRIRAVGGHLGVAIYLGRFSSFIAEWSRARIDAPGDRATIGTGSIAYALDF